MVSASYAPFSVLDWGLRLQVLFVSEILISIQRVSKKT